MKKMFFVVLLFLGFVQSVYAWTLQTGTYDLSGGTTSWEKGGQPQSLDKVQAFALQMPKVELHVHLEGTFSPELVMKIAQRNGIALPDRYNSLEKLQQAYVFKDLFSFLDLYTVCASVLKTEEDFRELTLEYLDSARKQGIVHAEIFVGFQTHMKNGVEFATVLNGVEAAMKEAAARMGITSSIILDIDRDDSEASAIDVLNRAIASNSRLIVGVGLAYAENAQNPPRKFSELYRRVHDAGLRATAHAGEAFGPEYVEEAIEQLKVHRIDHGVRSIEDDRVVQMLVDRKIPLTVCPLSNICLKVFEDMEYHPIHALMKKGVIVTINSDDPAYFGGGIEENYNAVIDQFRLSIDDVYLLGKNAVYASFLSPGRKDNLLKQLDEVYRRTTSWDDAPTKM
jgi:adenosine deaminase